VYCEWYTMYVVQKVRTLSVLIILKHVLYNSVTKLSQNLHQDSDKMFSVSAISSKQRVSVYHLK